MNKILVGAVALVGGWFLFFREKTAKAATVATVAPSTVPSGTASKGVVSPGTSSSSGSLAEAEAAEELAKLAVQKLDTKNISYNYSQYKGDSRESLAILIAKDLEAHPKKGTENKGAIAAFQAAVGLKQDGLYGKNTAAAVATYHPSGKAPAARYGV